MSEIRKQISLYFPLSEWKMLRAEAARLKIPITDLCKGMMEKGIKKLSKEAKND